MRIKRIFDILYIVNDFCGIFTTEYFNKKGELMKTLLKKSTCFLLALLMVAGVIMSSPTSAAASSSTDGLNYLYTSEAPETSTAGVAKSFSFSTKTTGPLSILVVFGAPTTFSYQLSSATGTVLDSDMIVDTDTNWYESSMGYVHGPQYSSSEVGTYNLSITTDTDTSYYLLIAQEASLAAISNSSISVTAGFTHKLSVSDASGKIKWKSSNTKIATVSSKGVVTGKTNGKCTVTATTADGQTLKCKVKVVKNVYKDTKVTNSGADNGKVTAYVYQASLDSSGNLVCKVRVINNTSNIVYQLNKTSITVRNANNKKVMSYTVGTKNITVSGYQYKDCTLTIPKSKVKSCDLVRSDISLSGSYTYRR